ncbi:cell division protein FtsZ [Desulfovibrio sp. OttesenSCG-928-G15]|nr:cell division protein FtsZ [Desulfovibrio sp. OttesenSCG-928-G15]
MAWAIVKVIGVGGAGINAVNHMIIKGIQDVVFIAADTDIQELSRSLAEHKIQLGSKLTKGLSAAANPQVGYKAAMESSEDLAAILSGSEVVFVVAGMGGGTGTGAAPVIASIAKRFSLLTAGIASPPFFFEGKTRLHNSDAGIAEFYKYLGRLIVIPIERVLSLAPKGATYAEALKAADEVLYRTIKALSDLILRTGLNGGFDFADVRTVLEEPGRAVVGIGQAVGQFRAREAALAAATCPLLDGVNLVRASQVLLKIDGAPEVAELSEIASIISEAAHEDVNVLFNTSHDDIKEDEICVTVIASGIN